MNEQQNMPAVRQQELELERSQDEWEKLKLQANIVEKSGLAPDNLRNKDAVLTVMLSARELDLPPMLGLRELYVVNGKVSMSAKLMAALVRQQGAGWFEEKHEFDHAAGEGWVWLKGHRVDGPAPEEETYETTWDIKRALPFMTAPSGEMKPAWRDFPDQMLWNRAMSEVCRRLFSDIIGGLYTPEEIGQGPHYDGGGGGTSQTQQPPQIEAPTTETVEAEAPERETEAPQQDVQKPDEAEQQTGEAEAVVPEGKQQEDADFEKQLRDAIPAHWDRGMTHGVLQLLRGGWINEPTLAAVARTIWHWKKSTITDIKGISADTYDRLFDALLQDTPKTEQAEEPEPPQETDDSPVRDDEIPGVIEEYGSDEPAGDEDEKWGQPRGGEFTEHPEQPMFREVAVFGRPGQKAVHLYRHKSAVRVFWCSECGRQERDYCEHLQFARPAIERTLNEHGE